MTERTLLSPGAQRALVLATAAVFLADIVYLYGVRFFPSIHSDTALTAIVVEKMLRAHSPILRDIYYSNGDVWIVASYWFAIPTIAIMGPTANALLAYSLLGTAGEIAVLTWCYRQFSRHRGIAALAMMATLIAWSELHVQFVYLQIAYGFHATVHALLFTLFGMWFARATSKERVPFRAHQVACLVLLGLLSAQHPLRALVFTFAPLLVCCALPWPSAPLRLRARITGAVLASFAIGWAVYRFVFKRVLTFSQPSGHNAFRVRDLEGIQSNLARIGEGLLWHAGSTGQLGLLVIPGILLMVGAVVYAVREIVRPRDLMTRLFCVAAVAQLVFVLGPLMIGNLVVNHESVHYLTPSILLLFGITAVIAYRDLEAPAPLARRRLALGWLLLLPVAGAVSLSGIVHGYAMAQKSSIRGLSDDHAPLAREITRRGLKHGFAKYPEANLVSFLSGGATRLCPVNFAPDGLIPYKWMTEVECFDESLLPDRIYVVEALAELETSSLAVQKTLGTPIERFEVGRSFAVSVFRTAEVSRGWLALPFPDPDQLRFPLRLPATYPLLKRGKAIEEHGQVIATGEGGTVMFGPYVTLPKGRYRLRWIGKAAPSEGELGFDVAAFGGKETVVATNESVATLLARPDDDLVALDFDLPAVTSEIELRVYSRGGAKVALDAAVLERR